MAADPCATAACDGSPSCPAEDHIVGCRRVPPESLDGFAWEPTTAARRDGSRWDWLWLTLLIVACSIPAAVGLIAW